MTASAGSVKNDIYTYGSQGVTFNGAGTYSFEGGIHTEAGSGGGLTLENGANVTLESGSINVIDNGLNINGATLNIVLNSKNRHENIADIPSFNDGATQFTVGGTNAASNGGVMKFVVDNAIQNYWYLGAIGNFNGWNNSMIITQVNGGNGSAAIAGEKLGSAIWLGITKGNFLAVRKSGGTTTQNESNTFNGAFETGSGAAFAANDVVYLANDLNATGEVNVGSGITAFGVVSNSTSEVCTITATGDHRFFNVEGGTAITLDNVTFKDGNAGSNNHGGAILSRNDNATLTLNSAGSIGTAFQNNSAVNGGAIEAGTVNLNGTFSFSNNTASLNKAGNGGEGGAIDAWNVTLSGKNTFTKNTAVNGGAIWAQNLTFEGTDSIAFFSNNTASESGNDIYIGQYWKTGAPGTLTFNDNGVYKFLDGIYIDGTTEMNDSVRVTFGNLSNNTMNGKTTINSQQAADFADGATLKFNGGLTLGNGVIQSFDNAEVTLAGTLGVTCGDPNSFNTQADFSSADSLTVADGTKFVIYDTAGNEMTAKDFAGKGIGAKTLVLGTPGSAELKKIVPDDFSYESLLYSVSLESGQDIVLKSSEKSIQPNNIEGNAASAAELFGKNAILDVQTADEVRALTNGATGELFASSAAAQMERLNYMNRLIIARTSAKSTLNQAGETIRGQQAEYSNSSVFGCSCRGTNDRKPNLWASGYYIGGETQMCGSINGQTYSCGGMLTGADWTSDFGKFGAFYGYSATGLDAIASNLESKDHTFGIWSRWNSVIGPGYTTVLGDFSFSNGEGRRFFQGNAWESDYSAWQGAVYLERGLEFVGERLNLNPYFSMQYVGYSADASSDTQLQYSAMDADSLRTILGMRIERDFCLRGRSAKISSGLAWDHELLNTDLIFTAERIGSGTVAPILGNSAGRDWFEYNTGITFDWTERLTLSADYYLFANKYSVLNAGMGTVTFRY
ncbi:MAG: autotransporter domain-containing protein [Planctomycetia bacterium]|nr:autotransporter domain-containing protein [Planctomycetia bacterium]